MLKKFLFFLLFFLILLLQAQDKTNIAVLDLKGESLSASDLELISSRLRVELVKTQAFNLVERQKMNDLLKEQGLQISGIVSDENIVKAGKLLGVQQMAAGSVGKIGSLYTINIRLIDVQSGKILKSASADNSKGIEALLTESVKNVAKRLAGKETLSLPNRYDQPNNNKNRKFRTPSLPQRAGGSRHPRNIEKIPEQFKNAPPEIKKAAKEVFLISGQLRKLNRAPQKNFRQKKETARLKMRRKALLKKIEDWQKKH